MISDSGHEVDALGHAGEEGRCRPRKSPVSCQTSVDPDVSEWGNPSGVKAIYCRVSEVALQSTRSELKHLSNSRKRNQARDSLSSGERNGNSLNQQTQVCLGLRDLNVGPNFLTKRSGKVGQSG
jgi:hypothetical protein